MLSPAERPDLPLGVKNRLHPERVIFGSQEFDLVLQPRAFGSRFIPLANDLLNVELPRVRGGTPTVKSYNCG